MSVRDESGFSFPELLVAMTIGLLVAATGMALLTIAVRAQPRTTHRAGQIQQGRVLIERLTRELRQGRTVTGVASSTLEILTFVDGSACNDVPAATSSYCRVTYSCSSSSCTRSVANPDGSAPTTPRVVADGITGPDVFSFAPGGIDPNYVGVELVYPGAEGAEAVTLSDGVSLRNHLATGTDP